MAFSEEYKEYPFLTSDEFNLACHYLDRKYISATLGQERRAFRLRMQSSFISDTCYISVARPIDTSQNDVSSLLDLSGLSWGPKEDEMEQDGSMDIDAENSDVVRNYFHSVFTCHHKIGSHRQI
jgi:ubiquitin-like-conjugating enzyme ATG10